MRCVGYRRQWRCFSPHIALPRGEWRQAPRRNGGGDVSPPGPAAGGRGPQVAAADPGAKEGSLDTTFAAKLGILETGSPDATKMKTLVHSSVFDFNF